MTQTTQERARIVAESRFTKAAALDARSRETLDAEEARRASLATKTERLRNLRMAAASIETAPELATAKRKPAAMKAGAKAEAKVRRISSTT